jgi:hypothetical protein
MEADIKNSDWFVAKVRANNYYAQTLYSACCNMQWQKTDVIPILKDELWGATWRYAGGMVADILGEGDYMDWYCSGIGGAKQTALNKYVPEGIVTDEIRDDLATLGWHPVPYNND